MQWVATFLALASLYGDGAISYPAQHPDVYAGTYVVRICKGSCASSIPGFDATGVVVLFDKPVRNNHGRVFRADLDRQLVNGCFVLKTADTNPVSIAKLAPTGFFYWAMASSGDAIDFQLYRSPDGGYGIRLKLAAKGLKGTGRIWGGAVGLETSGAALPADEVIADRIGDPDIKRFPSWP